MKLSEKNYYALLCYCVGSDNDPMLCGVYSSLKEAQEIGKEVKDCVAKHKIVKCAVQITYADQTRKV